MISQPPVRAIRIGMLYISLAALLWAAIESVGSLLVNEHHGLQVVWVRYAVHLALLLAIFAPHRKAEIVRTSRPGLQVTRGLFMLLMPICFLTAVSIGEPANVLSVFWIVPPLTMALSILMLREYVNVWTWPVVLGGGAGTILLIRPDGEVFGPAVIPALGMAICLSLYLVMTRMLRGDSRVTNLVFTSACVLLPLGLILPGMWSAPTARTMALMALIGVLGLGVLYAFDRAVESAPVAAVVPVLFLQPFWLVVLAAVFGGVRPGSAALVGLLMIATMIVLLVSQSNVGDVRVRQVSGDNAVAPAVPIMLEPVGSEHVGQHT